MWSKFVRGHLVETGGGRKLEAEQLHAEEGEDEEDESEEAEQLADCL